MRVEFLDSIKTPGWEDEPVCDLLCVALGHLVKASRDEIVLALTRSAYGHGHYISIPRRAVVSITRLVDA